jgi:aminoglycoside phosphotransferase (APT) family kinase protein
VTQAPPPADIKMQRSSRDASTVPAVLASWLATLLPEGADPQVTLLSGIDSNGMSSETLVLDASWTEDGRPREGHYVARVAPSAADVPVFPSYDLLEQYDVIKYVGDHTDVPVPAVGWMEPTGSVLGTPFFLMDRIEGIVPPDVMPYTFGDNWLFDASREDQRRLQDASVGALAGLHAIPDAAVTFGYLDPGRHLPDGGSGSPMQRNLAARRAWYEFAVPDLGRSPLVERLLDWLESHQPAAAGDIADTVLSWGDARIGNMMYRDFEPVAVLDWEMATIGPRELDVSWMVFAHQVFESIGTVFEMPGMPHFMREEDVVATYEAATGAKLGDLSWYHLYNATAWCVVFMRTGARQVRFGEIERPDDIESLFHCKPLVERVMAEVGA